MTAIETTTFTRPARSVTQLAAAIIRPLRPERAARRSQQRQVVLTVELTEPRGRRWAALGGGDTIAEAIAFARDSAPEGRAWEPVSWTEVYAC